MANPHLVLRDWIVLQIPSDLNDAVTVVAGNVLADRLPGWGVGRDGVVCTRVRSFDSATNEAHCEQGGFIALNGNPASESHIPARLQTAISRSTTHWGCGQEEWQRIA